jgi:hypothetical protein
MSNLLMASLFIILPILYIYVSLKLTGDISEENIIVVVLGGISTAFCYLYANTNFINVPAKYPDIITYVILCYAGTKSTLKYLFYFNKKAFHELVLKYIFITGIYLILEFIINSIAINLQNNLLLSIDKIIIPIYSLTMFSMNMTFYYRSKALDAKVFVTNYCLPSLLISIYEIPDIIEIITNYYKYEIWGNYYISPFSAYNKFWMIFVVTTVIITPRLFYMIEEYRNAK